MTYHDAVHAKSAVHELDGARLGMKTNTTATIQQPLLQATKKSPSPSRSRREQRPLHLPRREERATRARPPPPRREPTRSHRPRRKERERPSEGRAAREAREAARARRSLEHALSMETAHPTTTPPPPPPQAQGSQQGHSRLPAGSLPPEVSELNTRPRLRMLTV